MERFGLVRREARWMSRKRDVLEQLKRDELLTAVDRFELTVPDRRSKSALVEALVGSRKAGLAAILQDLSRNRLKEICRALALDDSGREKAVLIARLAGDAPALPPVAEATPPSKERASRPGVTSHLLASKPMATGSGGRKRSSKLKEAEPYRHPTAEAVLRPE